MNHKSEDLLIGNLKTMYYQTMQWMDNIGLYEGKLKLFDSLISERINTTTTQDLDHKELYRNMNITLFDLSDDLLAQIKIHRNALALLIEEKNVSKNHEYNLIHLELVEKMALIKQDVNSLKKALFKYIRSHPFDLNFDGMLSDI